MPKDQTNKSLMTPIKTVPNYLTLTRLLLVGPLSFMMAKQFWLAATVIFLIAVLSDILDGYLARTLDQTSTLGGLFDHATDAIFVCVGLSFLAAEDLVSHWLPPLVILSFVQYVLDSNAQSGQRLKSSAIGRANGIAYFVLLGCALGFKVLDYNSNTLMQMIVITSWFLCSSTIISMFVRAIALWKSARGTK